MSRSGKAATYLPLNAFAAADFSTGRVVGKLVDRSKPRANMQSARKAACESLELIRNFVHRSLTVTASMRRPAPATPPRRNSWGGFTGGRSLLVGGAAVFAAWGEPSCPGFPRRGNGKG